MGLCSCGSDVPGPKMGACDLEPLSTTIATHPSQETALTSQAALPAAAHDGSMELDSPGFCNQLQVVLPGQAY